MPELRGGGKGTYLLLLHLAAPQERLQVGRLGCFRFAAGYYLYVGSAFGAGGLRARLSYHRQRHKQRPHWHIDYLRPHAHLYETWAAACALRLEHAWCGALQALPELAQPVRGFGASDSHHRAHLWYLPGPPGVRRLSHALLPTLPLADPAVPVVRLTIERWQLAASGSA